MVEVWIGLCRGLGDAQKVTEGVDRLCGVVTAALSLTAQKSHFLLVSIVPSFLCALLQVSYSSFRSSHVYALILWSKSMLYIYAPPFSPPLASCSILLMNFDLSLIRWPYL